MGFVGNLLGFPGVKELWKSVNNRQSCRMSLVYYFFGSQCIWYMYTYIYTVSQKNRTTTINMT